MACGGEDGLEDTLLPSVTPPSAPPLVEDRSNEGDFSQVPNPTDRVSALTVSAAPEHACSRLQPALTRAPDPRSSACSGTLLLHLPSLLSPELSPSRKGEDTKRGSIEPIRGFRGINTRVLGAEGCLFFGMLFTTPKTRQHPKTQVAESPKDPEDTDTRQCSRAGMNLRGDADETHKATSLTCLQLAATSLDSCARAQKPPIGMQHLVLLATFRVAWTSSPC